MFIRISFNDKTQTPLPGNEIKGPHTIRCLDGLNRPENLLGIALEIPLASLGRFGCDPAAC